MKTANSVNLKWLKIFHLFAAILWIGCGIAMNLLRVTITPTTPEGMFTLSLAIKILDESADLRRSHWHYSYRNCLRSMDKMGLLQAALVDS